LDGLGDLVISTAALREIRHGFPSAKITLVVSPWSNDMAKCVSHYDRLIVHDCFLFSFFRGNRKVNIGNELRFIRKLRKSKFDLGIDLRGDLLSLVPLFLSGAKFRFGKGTRGGGFLLTHIVRWSRTKDSHEKDKSLKIAEALRIGVNNRDLELTIPQLDKEYVQKFLTGKGIRDNDFIVTIAPRALYRWRSWGQEKFGEVASIIATELNGKVILTGTREDRGILERVSRFAISRPINSAGEFSLSQVAALIAQSTVFIGNDSGLIHVSAALKTPMIQLFGPGEPEKFGYTNKRNILLMNNDCRYHPCAQKKCRYPDDWCMDKISVKDVIGALKAIRTSFEDVAGTKLP